MQTSNKKYKFILESYWRIGLQLLIASFLSINTLWAQPSNDDFANSVDITSLINGCSADAAFTTVNASSDLNAGSNWRSNGGVQNVWFHFIAPASGEIDINVDIGGIKGTQTFTQIALWEADGTTELNSETYYNAAGEDADIGYVGLVSGNVYYVSIEPDYGAWGTFTLCLQDQVDYDFYEGAIDVTSLINGCSADAQYNTRGASPDRNPGSTWGSNGPMTNRWFSFTAPLTGEINVTIDRGAAKGSQRYTQTAIWEADGTTELISERFYNINEDLIIGHPNLTPGITYYISVDADYNQQGTFTLCLEDQVDYDYYEGAIDVTGLINGCSADAIYDTRGATGDRSAGSEWNTAADANRWFSFIAPPTGQIHIETDIQGVKGSQRYSQIALWQADGLTEVVSENYYGQYEDVDLGHVGLIPGNQYYISIDTYSVGARGTFSLCLQDQVDYDFYEGAFDVTSLINSCSADAAFDTRGASLDRNAGSEWGTGAEHNRWFMFTAPATGEIHVVADIQGSKGSQRFSEMALWETDGVTELASETYNGQYEDIDLGYVGLTPGNTYYISMDTYAISSRGTFTLCLQDQVDYDFYEGAIDVGIYMNGCSPNAIYSSNGASPDRNPGSNWTITNPRTNRWFKFTATTQGVGIIVDIDNGRGTQNYSQLALWESDGLTEIASVGSNVSDSDMSLLATNLTLGVEYYISVDTYSQGHQGTFTLCFYKDTDADSVIDINDLDDDNDGILDSEEGCENTDIEGTIGLGNNVTHNSTYAIGGTDVTYTLNNPNNAGIYGYDAQLNGHSIRIAGNAGGESGSLISSYSTPIKAVFFKVTDFDHSTEYTIDVYDENNILYDLTAHGIVSLGSRITQTGNFFVADSGDTDGDDPADDQFGSIVFYFPGTVSRIELNFNYPSSSSTRFTQPTFCILDTDNDGLPDFQDLDSDGDGIPDNVEAQTSIGYIAPNGSVDTSGIDTAYSGGLTPVNSDGVDNPDFIDLDSDNEGNNDASEAALVPSGNDIDNDGLDDASDEDTSGYSDSGGTVDNPLSAPLALPDLDSDATAGGDVDFRDASDNGADSDGDGVPDSTDVDDDNDGIPDIHEQDSFFECDETFIIDGAHSVNTHTTTNLNTTASGITYDYSTLNGVLLDTSVIPAHNNIQGGNHPAEFIGAQDYIQVGILTDRAAGQQATLTINFPNPVKNPTLLFSSLKDNAGSNLPSTYAIYYDLITPNVSIDKMSGDVDFYVSGNRIGATMLSPGVNGTGVARINGVFTQLTFEISHITNNNDDGLITTLINMGYYSCVDTGYSASADTDNDGILNTLDLDSDNDGIYDAVEAGHNQPNTDGRLDGSVGSDGLPDAVRLMPDYSSINYDISESLEDSETIPDFLDLDSDGDGLPDNVEAQTTIGYAAPNTDSAATYLANNGVNSAYLGGLIPTNTDATDSPDYLDLDSDNEGDNDTRENRISLSGIDSDNDGLDDTTDEYTSSYADPGGTIDAPLAAPMILPDVDSDATSGGDVDFRDATDDRPDHDNDGVPDIVDLDDDNDGILDTDEGCGNLVINGNFEAQDFSSTTEFPGGAAEAGGTYIGSDLNTNNLYGWSYTENLDGWVGDQSLSYWSYINARALNGSQYLDILGNNARSGGVNNVLTQEIHTVPGESYIFSFYWGEDIGHRVGDPVEMDVAVTDELNNDLINQNLTAVAEGIVNNYVGPRTWYRFEQIFIATSELTTIRFESTPDGTANGTALDYVQVFQNGPCRDTDNDGVPDVFDLDSDNDGILDAEEAGHGQHHINGVVNGSTGIDGIPDSVQNDPDREQVNYTLNDNDIDGVNDFLDLDADGDGIPDNVEAQTTIGYTAPSGSVDANGIDTSYAAGLVPTNTDGTDNPDYLDLDSDNEGENDTVEAAISLTGNDADNDGLDDATDATPDYTDVGGTIDDPLSGSVILPDVDNDATTGGDVDFRDAVDDAPVDIDSDDDGILDSFEDWNLDNDDDPTTDPTNSDNDAFPDYLDIDSDDDGIPDNVEAQTTSGYIPPSLVDANNNGLDDAYENGVDLGLIPINTDGADLPDYLDDDSDGDGVPDNIEGHDHNTDGVPDVVYIGSDKDDDGLDDNYEGIEQIDIDVNDEIDDPINDLPNTDGDSESDYRDLDDDDDGIPTMGEDPNGDMDYSNDDWDNDGIPDYLDSDIQSDEELEIYNVITPNADGIHDVLTIRSIENYPNNDIKIFNRWGVLVFETAVYNNRNNNFDGRSRARVTVNQDELLPKGTYFYILKYQDLDGSWKQLSGHLYLN